MNDTSEAAIDARALRYADTALSGVCAILPHLVGLVALVVVQVDRRVDTACVFASGRILINPDWFRALSTSEAIFVLAHEVMHLALQSHERGEGADGTLFNIAHDFIINDMLCEELDCRVPAGGLWLYGAAKLSAERIVSDLRQEMRAGAPLPQPGWGARRKTAPGARPSGAANSAMIEALRKSGLISTEGEDTPTETGSARPGRGDVLSADLERQWFPDENPRDVSDWREEIREAARTAVDLGILRQRIDPYSKARGEDPADEVALIHALQSQQAPPWQQAVQQWIEAVRPGPRTYNRPSRRGADRTDLVLPGRKREGWTLHLVLDTSGSMVESLPMILGAISAFCEEMGIDVVHILQCDVEVTSDESVSPEELAAFPIAGFGGSDMTPAMMRLAQDPEVEVVLVLTDGWISYPETPMPYDVLWVLDYRNGFAPPYGQIMALIEYQ